MSVIGDIFMLFTVNSLRVKMKTNNDDDIHSHIFITLSFLQRVCKLILDCLYAKRAGICTYNVKLINILSSHFAMAKCGLGSFKI